MLNLTKHLVKDDGIWLAMKSTDLALELLKVTYTYQVKTYTVAHVPGQRCCVIIKG